MNVRFRTILGVNLLYANQTETYGVGDSIGDGQGAHES